MMTTEEIFYIFYMKANTLVEEYIKLLKKHGRANNFGYKRTYKMLQKEFYSFIFKGKSDEYNDVYQYLFKV